MELPPVSNTTITTTTTVKTPDLETEPQQSNTITKQLISPPLTTTNGILKRHKPLHHHHHQPPPTTTFTYKECLKNHAAAMGSHATDGCGEFILDDRLVGPNPTSLKCAACGCHRNFHRRQPADSPPSPPPPPIQHLIEYQPHHRQHPPQQQQQQQTSGSPLNSPSPPPISTSYYPSSAPHMLLALSSPDHTNHHHTHPTTGKKRFRTKFTQVQKEKMHQVAEKIGWKMQKKDQELINGICNEIGVDRNVFKVWMHNNKSNNRKDGDNSNGIDFIISKNNINHEAESIGVDQGVNRHVDHHLHLNGSTNTNVNVSCFSNVVVGGNLIKGSSSSC